MASVVEIRKQAKLYLDGKSFREIAAMYNISHVTVRENITNVLSGIDLSLYDEVMKKINDNTAKSVKDKGVQKRILKEVDMFLCGATLEEISNLNGVSYDTVYRDLSQRIIRLQELRPDILSKEAVDVIRNILKQNRLSNLSPGNDGAYLTQPRNEKGKFTK